VRPSDEKFMDISNFLMGEFRPVKKARDGRLGGGFWLGREFY